MELLLDILTYRREHGSKGELAFINKYMNKFQTLKDPEGEILGFYFDNRSKNQRTLFVSHIDSVHHGEIERIHQDINYDKEFDIIYADKNSNCLGADDGSGVSLLLEMIRADKKGFYLFTRGEEKGCIGSKGIAQHHPDFLAQFDHAIQFDRKGVDSIITHQMGARSCSDSFANKLATLFNVNSSLLFKPDNSGVYTDTAEFTHLIPECTNISIGYFNQHTNSEYQDYKFYKTILEQVLAIEWHKITLPVDRDTSEMDYFNYQDDIRLMQYDEIKAWVKSSSDDEIALTIEELLFDLDYNSRAYRDY